MTSPTHNQDSAQRPKGVVRTALVLGVVALAIYVGFILSGVLNACARRSPRPGATQAG